MVGLFQHAVQFAGQALVHAPAKICAMLSAAQSKQPQIAGALEELVDGKVAPKDQIAAVFNWLSE